MCCEESRCPDDLDCLIKGQVLIFNKVTHSFKSYECRVTLVAVIDVGLDAEGYESAPAVRQLAAKMGVDMPICLAVSALLSGETTVDQVIDDLLSRPLKTERE